jgi:hypothetical protein
MQNNALIFLNIYLRNAFSVSRHLDFIEKMFIKLIYSGVYFIAYGTGYFCLWLIIINDRDSVRAFTDKLVQ